MHRNAVRLLCLLIISSVDFACVEQRAPATRLLLPTSNRSIDEAYELPCDDALLLQIIVERDGQPWAPGQELVTYYALVLKSFRGVVQAGTEVKAKIPITVFPKKEAERRLKGGERCLAMVSKEDGAQVHVYKLLEATPENIECISKLFQSSRPVD